MTDTAIPSEPEIEAIVARVYHDIEAEAQRVAAATERDANEVYNEVKAKVKEVISKL